MFGNLGVQYRGNGHSPNKISDKITFSGSTACVIHVYYFISSIKFIKNFFNLDIYYNSGIFNRPTAARMTVVSSFIANEIDLIKTIYTVVKIE